MDTRRSKRTPKPKVDTTAKILKAKSNIKDVVNNTIETDAPTEKGGATCKKRVVRKSRTLGKFVIDCHDITGEKKIDLNALKIHLQGKIKVQGKRNDKRVKVETEGNNILIHADVFIEKKYIKYLIKIFLKDKKLNNWIQIINEKHSYALKYFRKDN